MHCLHISLNLCVSNVSCVEQKPGYCVWQKQLEGTAVPIPNMVDLILPWLSLPSTFSNILDPILKLILSQFWRKYIIDEFYVSVDGVYIVFPSVDVKLSHHFLLLIVTHLKEIIITKFKIKFQYFKQVNRKKESLFCTGTSQLH